MDISSAGRMLSTLITKLASLKGDVSISSPANLDILQYVTSTGKWTNRQPVGTETNTTPVAGANDTVISANLRRFTFFTLPSTAAFYVITGIEWLNGTVVNGSTHAAIFRVDASPPVDTQKPLVAWGTAAQAGASGVQRVNLLGSMLVQGGTLLGASICTGSATGKYGTTTVASANNSSAFTAAGNQPTSDTATWAATTEEPYIKVYYKPVLGV